MIPATGTPMPTDEGEGPRAAPGTRTGDRQSLSAARAPNGAQAPSATEQPRETERAVRRAAQQEQFGHFARLEAARTRQIRGTGLGPYICRHLMQAMGGYVWLRTSEAGGGSTFALALPTALLQA